MVDRPSTNCEKTMQGQNGASIVCSSQENAVSKKSEPQIDCEKSPHYDSERIKDSDPEKQSKQKNEDEEKDEDEHSTNNNDDGDITDEEERDRISTHQVCRNATRLTSRSKSSWKDPGPPPDGGLKAWTQVVMVHLIVFGTWGYITSFGVFQTYYVQTLGHPPSDISWVGSVQVFLLFFVGAFSGRATDAGYFRHIFLLGTVLQLVGMFMTSLCTKYWQLFLAQGVCTGLGDGLIFCPSIALLSTYFSKHRAVALALAASGTATGGMILPVVVRQLLPQIGFGWTVRVIAFIVLGTQTVALAFTRTRIPPRKSGAWVEWGAFREMPYALFTLGMFLCFWGIYFAFYYVGSFGRDIIHISQADSISMLLIMNGVGLVSRFAAGYAADRWFGAMNMLIPVSLTCGIVLYGWHGVHSRGGLFAFAVVYGIAAAAMQGLFPATLSSLTTDLKRIGVRMGMVFSVISFACLTGAPIGGALVQNDRGDYLYAQMFAGSCMVCASLVLFAARCAKVGFKLARA